MKTTERQRQRLRILVDDTTSGDWYARDVYVYRTDDPRDHRQVCRVPTVQVDPRTPHKDALFIAAAKRDLPDLLDDVDYLKQTLKEVLEIADRRRPPFSTDPPPPAVWVGTTDSSGLYRDEARVLELKKMFSDG